ncbi:hypothetical protein KKH3_21010 [Pectobacterium actinidiae]|nr:hypothetical protein KKH3_21010 [Pectobacterium actinidiae]
MARIIAEMSHNNGATVNISPTNEQSGRDNGDMGNVYPLFGDNQQGSSDKKH